MLFVDFHFVHGIFFSGTTSVTNSTVILIVSSLLHTAMSLRVRLCPETPDLSHARVAFAGCRSRESNAGKINRVILVSMLEQ
jgi:hypothetical protein